MSIPNTCRCCGAAVVGERAKIRRCIVCDRCDRRHGDELQAIVTDLVTRGEMPWDHALARMLLDDAHYAGMLIVIQNEQNPGMANLWIERPVPRWRVYVGRARAAGQSFELQTVIDLVIWRHMDRRNTAEARAEITAEVREALTFLGAELSTLEVSASGDVLDPGHLMLRIEGRVPPPPEPGAVVFEQEAEMPADIMQRTRGQA